MSCLSDDEVLVLLAGGLPAEARAEAHIDTCRRCRLLVSTLAAKTGDSYREGAPNAFSEGDTVASRYKILALIGCGGMGEVYKVLDTVLSETVALKTLSAGTALDERGIARLKTEVQVARRVTHRNVCRVFDVGFHEEDGSIPFFTMELLGGVTLRSRLRSAGPLPLDEARALLEQMASGLDAAHAAGIVHRDLKSENVILVPDDNATRVVITDFGLARQHAEQTLRQIPIYAREASLAGKTNDFIAGTLGYMAPEQLSGEPTGPATDIYALGVVLYESLTGELPFKVGELAPVGGAILDRPLPLLPPSTRVPPAWEAAIRRCLEASPIARFQSAREVLAALDGQPTASRWRRRARMGRAAGAVAVAALAISAVAAIGLRSPGARAPSPARATVVEGTPTAAPPRPEPSPEARFVVGVAPEAAPAPPAPAPGSRKVRRRPSDRPLPRSGGALAASAMADPPDAMGKDDFIDPFGSR